jgi:hypothetical protein
MTTTKTIRETAGKAARCLAAAVLAIGLSIPATAARADDANDAVINIHSYGIDGAYEEVNSGVGYMTDGGEISYCYDFNAHGPGDNGQDYTDVRDGTPATDYLFAKGYPSETKIADKDWPAAKAQAITQVAAWIVSGTADESSGSFSRADQEVLDAAHDFADEAEAYQGGDKSIDGCSAICYVDGKPSVQAMLTGSLGGRVTVTKTSADASVTAGNGEYSPAGAVYGIYGEDGGLAAKVTIGADGTGTTDQKLKSGTYTVREIEAPDGWTLSTKEHKVMVRNHDAQVEDAEAPVTVELDLVKTDVETGEPSPQGAASLDGAVYEATYQKGGKAETQSATVEGGKAVFSGIPLGKFTVRETKAPEGYLPDTEAHELEVTAETAGHSAATFSLQSEDEFSEQVKRGDLELVKVTDGDQKRLAGVPFSITSKTTGESHTIVTDANGYASTSASWNSHTNDTNGGKADSGVWFGGGDPDDAKGALVYDTYTVEEQRCEANADRALIPAFDVTVYRDGATVNLGTLTNDEGPKIGTTATDAADGDHEATEAKTVEIADDVAYSGLKPGKEYKLTGTLMDRATGKPVQNDGKNVTAETSFTPTAANGVATVTFKFDATGLAGHDTVAFESLSREGHEVAAHADIEDEGQTVKVVPPAPSVGTTATDADDGDQEAAADDRVEIVDEVAYENLEPGKEYTLTGTLMDKANGKPIQSNGKDVTSTVSFAPESSSGTVDVRFEFDGSALAGHDVVAFESLDRDGKEVAAHADIDDEGQTVKLVSPPTEDTPSGETAKGSLPKTGDDAPWVPLACAAGAAACAAGAIALARAHGRKLEDGSDSVDSDGGEE